MSYMSRGSFANHVTTTPQHLGRARGCRAQDIDISSKIQARPHRMPNLEAESKALRILARMMAHSPRQVPDTLLHLALELCRAGTAGISEAETLPENKRVFHWTNVAGVLKKYSGGFTPRDSSPCAVAFDRKAPQLFKYPARQFQDLHDIPVQVVEALVIPFVGAARAGTIWIFSHDEGVGFDNEDVRMMTNLADFANAALHVIQILDADSSARHDAAPKIAKETVSKQAHGMERTGTEESLRKFTGRLLQLRDEEQRRLARELHDSVGQLLVAMSMNHHKALAEQELSPVAACALRENTLLLARVSGEIRTISHLLHPPLLDEIGLASAIQGYLEGFASRCSIKVRLEMAEDFGRLPRDLETALFRIVQEGLTNVHRHSGSQYVTIRVMRSLSEVSVAVADAGRGIPRQKVCEIESGRASGIGLQGMRERVRQLGGSFRIRSNDKGTVVVTRLPLKEAVLPETASSSVLPLSESLTLGE
jgi:signal transduction histidine kinase